MSKVLLTIQHDGVLFSPPVEEGVQIEWERTGSPGKLTFTTVTPSSGGSVFTEGDPVCFYYDDKPVFMGYVFTKKHDREKRIQVTCYDQLRYLKNKFSYVFENKTATEIVKALCADFELHVGALDDTKYVIPAIAEENKSAVDILLDVLDDTLLNTGNMFVLYDDFGEIRLSNSANMISSTLIYNKTAENFDFSSSIDDETYNQVILYYKQDDQITQIYTASSPTTMKQWGTLRFFEEVKNPTIGQNKANSLLKLYNKKTRALKVSGAFGDISVRGGTLIPIQLDLGEIIANNFMLVEKVVHNFNKDNYTMDLTLEGAWEDKSYDIVSKTIGELKPESTNSGSGGSGGGGSGGNSTVRKQYYTVTITDNSSSNTGTYSIAYNKDNTGHVLDKVKATTLKIDKGGKLVLMLNQSGNTTPKSVTTTGSLTGQDSALVNSYQTKKAVTYTINEDSSVHVTWNTRSVGGGSFGNRNVGGGSF